MKESFSITQPLTIAEATVLGAYAMQSVPDVSTPSARVEWATTTQTLVKRGLLAKTVRGIIVEPEGLAAILDTVPIDDLTRMGSRSAAGAAPAPDAATRPSRAPRRSAEPSSRRGRAAS